MRKKREPETGLSLRKRILIRATAVAAGVAILTAGALCFPLALDQASTKQPAPDVPVFEGEGIVDPAGEDSRTITDVAETDWFYPAFTFCWQGGAFQDVPLEGRFDGGEPVSRAMFVTMLYNMFAADIKAEPVAFSDVGEDDWFYDAVQWGVSAGIVTGGGDGTFRPQDPVSREQMMCMLARIAKGREPDWAVGSNRFLLFYPDRGQISGWAQTDVLWCLQEGVAQGVVGETLRPQEALTRAEAAQAVMNYSARVENGASQAPAVPASASAVTLSGGDHDALQQQISVIAGRYGAMGLSVAYVENGVVADTFSYGYAIKNEQLMTADTKIRVASLSKILIGLATHLSVENGLMDLDANIGEYWGFTPQTHAKGDVITARSLLTHTSSVQNTDSVAAARHDAMAKRLKDGGGIRSVVSGNIANWSYNNYAMDVLGITVELANNRELDDILGEYLYEPLSLDAAFYGGDLKDTSQIATIYRYNGSVGRSAQATADMHSDGVPGSNGSSFAGGLVTSAYDMGKIAAVLANDGVYNGVRFLPKSVVESMEAYGENFVSPFYQAQPLRYREDGAYGQSALYYHTGSAYGVYNLLCYNPETGRGVVVLTNGASGNKDDNGIYAVCGEIAALLLNDR